MTSLTNYTPVFRNILLAAIAVLLISSCGIYKINVQQGNFLDQKKIDQVETGMTRNQVKFLLGTPMIADSFNKERWDYVFWVKSGRTGQVASRRITVFFDGDKVSEVEQSDQEQSSDS